MRLAQSRIQALSKELEETKELLKTTETKKREIAIQKNELEDKEFNLSNRLK